MSQHDPFGPEKYDAYQEPQFASPPSERKGPGCLFWGCLISGILFLIGIILVIALVFFVRGKIVDVMREYTEPQPAELPEIQITQEERQEVISRWEAFRRSLDEGQEAELVLDSDEFNVIALEEFPEAQDHLYFTIEGDRLRGQLSLPVQEFGQKILRTDKLDGRYFNASGTFDVFLRNGLLVLQLQDAEVKGEPVPDEAMQQIRTQNLAEKVADNPEKRELFSKFRSISVEDGRIVLKSKGATAPAEGEASEAVDDPEPAAEPTEPTSNETGDDPTAPDRPESPASPDVPAPPTEPDPATAEPEPVPAQPEPTP